VIGIAGTPITYVVFSRLLRIVESVRSGVAFTTDKLDWAILSPDGRHMAIVKENNSSNVSLLENSDN
jgi:hypothetical protein